MTLKPPLQRFDPRRLFLRWFSFALAFPMVATVFVEIDAAGWKWASLIFGCLVLPLLVRVIALKVPLRRRARIIEVLASHLIAGSMAAFMAFNALPCAVTIASLGMDSTKIGGWRLLWRSLLCHAIGVVLGILTGGFQWRPMTDSAVMLATLPLLLGQPLLMSFTMRRTIVESELRHELLELQNRFDGLSGLYNRTYWESLVRNEFANCQQDWQPTTLVMADLDHFKRVNDEHGHEAGDEVIRRFSQMLRERMRSTDACGRYGGEEFGLLLPRTTGEEALRLVENLRRAMRERPLLDGRMPVTASFGIAELGRPVDSHESWMRLSDQMLYRAKHSGRDCAVVLGDEHASPAPVAKVVSADFAPLSSLRDHGAVERLMCGLHLSHMPIAVYDPSDRLAFANPSFAELWGLTSEDTTFADTVRRCHRDKVFMRIESDDIDEWLRVAASRRRSKPNRAFVVESLDGRWFHIAETSFDDGWLMVVMTELDKGPQLVADTEDMLFA